MEKINLPLFYLSQKGLLSKSYEFLKFVYFSGFYFDFSEFLKVEKFKKGVYVQDPCGANVAMQK